MPVAGRFILTLKRPAADSQSGNFSVPIMSPISCIVRPFVDLAGAVKPLFRNGFQHVSSIFSSIHGRSPAEKPASAAAIRDAMVAGLHTVADKALARFFPAPGKQGDAVIHGGNMVALATELATAEPGRQAAIQEMFRGEARGDSLLCSVIVSVSGVANEIARAEGYAKDIAHGINGSSATGHISPAREPSMLEQVAQQALQTVVGTCGTGEAKKDIPFSKLVDKSMMKDFTLDHEQLQQAVDKLKTLHPLLQPKIEILSGDEGQRLGKFAFEREPDLTSWINSFAA